MTWSTERRINAAFTLAIALLIGMAAVAFHTVRQFNLASDLVPHTFDVWNAIQRSFSSLREVETGTRGFIITGDESFLGPYQRGSVQVQPALDRLRALTRDNPAQQARIDRFEPMVATELALAAHAIEVRRREGFAAAAAIVVAARDQDNMDRIRNVVQELRAEENRLLAERLAKSRSEAKLMVGALGVGLVLDFALLGAIYQITRRDRDRRERAAAGVETARLYAESIVDTVREPLLILSADLEVTRANRSFYRTFGTPPQDVEKRRLRELDEGRWNVPELLERLAAVAAEAAPFDGFEVTRTFRTLGERTMLLNARRLNAPGHPAASVLLAMEDITARKRTEHMHAQFRALFESLPGLYLVLQPDLTIVAVSDAYLKATMTRRETILGRGLFEIFPDNPDDPRANGTANLRASLERVREHGVPETMGIQKYDVRRSDGVFEERYWTPVNSPVLGADRHLEYIIHRVEDVTDFVLNKKGDTGNETELRARMEQMEAEIYRSSQEVTAASDRLRAANSELESFSYSVSHDLRAPLRHIEGFAQMLTKQAGPLLDDTGKRYLATISGSAKRLGILIDELLVFSRMSRTQMRHTRFDMRVAVDDVLRNLQPETEGRKIDWHIGDLPTVAGDPIMVRQVWVNLLSNALKYSRRKPVARVEISHRSDPAEGHVFSVRDNGAGFDMAYAGKLFGVFQRLHSTEEFEGTGIGLANVQRIVQRHGGRVWAEGVVGGGASFYFSLPAAKPPGPEPVAPVSAPL